MRSLYAWEIEAARLVLGDNLDYRRVWVHEGAGWPNWMNRLGRWLRRLPPPEPGTDNAITLGNHCFFPVTLPAALPPPGGPQDYTIGWLLHELTHAWQYQRLGWRYLALALGAQFRLGDRAYDLDPPVQMMLRRAAGWRLAQYNPEQQASLVAAAYYLKRDPSANREMHDAYTPFLADLETTV